jgi:sirohydrochlorin ferrochelatase
MDRVGLEHILSRGSRPPEVEEAIERLQAERWSLYMRLVAPYFSQRPRPELVEVWRTEASGSVARRLALADHEEALDLLLACVNGAESS